MNIPNIKDERKRNKCKTNIIRDFNIDDKYKSIGNNKTYFIRTYGCQMNERDSEVISGILEQMGFKSAPNYLSADLNILNTCAIRENTHNKVYGMLGRLKNLKESKKIIIGVCGCMSQEESVVENIINNKKFVDFVIGTHNIEDIPRIIYESIDSNSQIIEVKNNSDDILEDLPIKRVNNYKAFVNISYGCDNFCTYCIVPYTRGREKSRLKEDIVNEVKELVNKGYKEVTLLGQNVNSYGKDLGYSFSDLLKEVSDINVPRIRFVTSNPWEFSEDIIKLMKERKNIIPHIHLPVQSGSNNILKLMGRKYTKEDYIELVLKIRDNVEGCSITTDIIVGFPNESEEDFNETLDLVNKCKFDGAYTFVYSPRVGTPAALIKDNISLEEKDKRLSILNKLINEYSFKSNEKLVGTIVSVLIDDKSSKPDYYVGYTDTNKLINVKCKEDCIGKIINAKVTSNKSWSLYGEVIL